MWICNFHFSASLKHQWEKGLFRVSSCCSFTSPPPPHPPTPTSPHIASVSPQFTHVKQPQSETDWGSYKSIAASPAIAKQQQYVVDNTPLLVARCKPKQIQIQLPPPEVLLQTRAMLKIAGVLKILLLCNKHYTEQLFSQSKVSAK